MQEVSSSTGLTINVVYFVLPEEDFGSLVRTTTITNTNAKPVKMSVLDGLAKMEVSERALTKTRNTRR